MPVSRPSWKGYIKLALVSCPIALWPAVSSSERIAFRQINKKTGNRIRQQMVDEGTREPVELKDKARGYELNKDQYLLFEDEELKAIEVESSRTVEIDAFVPRAEIDERYLDSPYYIAPNEPVGAEAFAVIREAMRDKKMVALARVVLSSREHVIMLQPWEKGMLGTTIRYPYELRKSSDYFSDIPDVKIDPELLRLAEHILLGKSTPFDPSRFVDRYEQAVIELIETKRKGHPANSARSAPIIRGPIDLMEALKRSLGSQKAAPANDMTPGKPAKVKKAKPRVEGQRELLLPITGGVGAKTKPAVVGKPGRKAG